MKRTHSAFTLIELLVVIAIIASLMGVLMPALNRAREQARSVACRSRMRQIAMASIMYTQENDGRFARSSHSAAAVGCLRWGPAFMPYLGYGRYEGSKTPAWEAAFGKFYRCYSDKRKNLTYSYGKNVWFELEAYETAEALEISNGPTYQTVMKVRRPAATVEFGELRSPSAEDHFMAHFWLMNTELFEGMDTTLEIDTERHRGKANYSYVDGHVEAQHFEETFDIKNHVDRWNPGRAR